MAPPIIRTDMPDPKTIRHWTPNKKAVIVQAVHTELITLEAALDLYNISREEFDGWKKGLLTGGIKALRVTYLQS